MSKFVKNMRRRAGWLTVVLSAFMVVLCAFAEGPQWWTGRSVLNASPVNDYAAVNLGQLKWIATNAYDECIAQGLPLNAEHAALKLVLDTWFVDDYNYAAVNVGQLKHLGSLFHAWLGVAGYADAMSFSNDAFSLYAANIGQVKNVFNFVPSGFLGPYDPDYDQDGLLDAWEQQIVDADPNDLINSVEDVRPQDDFDGDGVSNGDESSFGTDPLQSSAMPPVVGFSSGITVASEIDGQATITVSVNPAPIGNITFNVSVAGGTAVNGSDYNFVAANVELTPLILSSNLQFIIFADQVREPMETVKLVISALSAGAVLGSSEHYVQITDDTVDSDGDGLPDWWEMKCWGNLGQDVSGDPDADLWNNLKEYNLGADPTMGWVPDTDNILQLQVKTPLDN